VILFNLNLIQSQPFSWARLKISSTSTSPPLNTTLFLWFYISKTIVTYIPFNARLTPCLWLNRQKLWKLTSLDSCLTATIPTHLSHISHTCCATLQVLNRCLAISASPRHNEHCTFPTWTLLLAKLDLVGNLSKSNLHAHTIAQVATFKDHNAWKVSEVCIRSSQFKILYPDLTVYSWRSSLTHTNLSWPLTSTWL